MQAVDRALSDHGMPPGIVRANRTGREHGETMYMVLVWDVSRTGALGGVRLNWEEETGWAYGKLGVSWQEAGWASDRLGIQSRDAIVQEPFSALRRVFAAPGDVADAAEHLVRHWRLPGGEYAGEWDQAGHVRAAIDVFRRRPAEHSHDPADMEPRCPAAARPRRYEDGPATAASALDRSPHPVTFTVAAT